MMYYGHGLMICRNEEGPRVISRPSAPLWLEWALFISLVELKSLNSNECNSIFYFLYVRKMRGIFFSDERLIAN